MCKINTEILAVRDFGSLARSGSGRRRKQQEAGSSYAQAAVPRSYRERCRVLWLMEPWRCMHPGHRGRILRLSSRRSWQLGRGNNSVIPVGDWFPGRLGVTAVAHNGGHDSGHALVGLPAGKLEAERSQKLQHLRMDQRG